MKNNFKTLKVALDFDETFTADIETFSEVVRLFKFAGHEVVFVTYRGSKGDNYDIDLHKDRLGIDVIYTNGNQKKNFYDADIWIDDSPECIVSYTEMQKQIQICEMSGDTK